MNQLPCLCRPAYAVLALATAGVEFSSSVLTRRVAPDRRFFVCRSSCYGGLRGGASRSAGVLVDRSANPVSVRRPILFSSKCGGLSTTRSPHHG